MSYNLIVCYSAALPKQVSEVLQPPGIGTIRPSQNSGIFYSKLLGLSFSVDQSGRCPPDHRQRDL